MKSGVTVTKDDTRQVFESIQAMVGKRVLIGIPTETSFRKPDGKWSAANNNAALGFIHTKGSPARGIPATPFLEPGVESAKKQASVVLKKFGARAFKEPASIDQGLHAVGQICRDSVKRHIVQQIGFEPLKPATIKARRKKGYKGSKRLIRTHQLLDSITYVVRAR